MTTYGPKNPQQIQSNWDNHDNAKVSDGNTASKLLTAAGSTERLKAVKFQMGTAPPRAATITATVKRHADGPGVKDEEAYLIVNGSPVGANKATGRDWAQSPEVVTYVFTADLPGPTVVNQDNFGLQIGVRASKAAQTAHIDGITLQVDN